MNSGSIESPMTNQINSKHHIDVDLHFFLFIDGDFFYDVTNIIHFFSYLVD